MPVGSSAQAAAISRPRTRGEGDRGLGREHAGERGRGELADAVPGGQRDVVQRQVLGGEQGGGDQQRLGPGGVLDFVRVGLGAEVDQVDAGQRGPPAQAGLGAGEVEPGVRKPGFWEPWPGASTASTVTTLPDAGGSRGRRSVPNPTTNCCRVPTNIMVCDSIAETRFGRALTPNARSSGCSGWWRRGVQAAHRQRYPQGEGVPRASGARTR